MLQQLHVIEIVLKLAAGLALIIAPRSLARLLGLPSADEPFWPRLLGSVLVGIAAATILEGQLPARNGLGIAGSIAINIAGAMMIAALLLVGRAGSTKRGRALLWLTTAALTLLSLVELAWAGGEAG